MRLSGGEAPYEMSKAELLRWGQEDDPVEATAIFPPDRPEGWPAKEYTRAGIDYLDGLGRTVNVASPGGAISTTEYNEYSEVKRTLSAGNREAALKEGSKSVEVAVLLSTENIYELQNGGRLESSLGPQHTVKLSTGGAEKLARNHVHYYYDEGEPSEGGPYQLVTKSTDTAQVAGKDETEGLRTTTTSYSGQGNLGWRLRKPTSVTTDPNRLKLTATTLYNEATGAVLETRHPTAEFAASYSSQFGAEGTGGGQFKAPGGIAFAPNGNVWVVDTTNNRVQELTSSGTFVEAIGWGVGGKAEFQVCTSSCQAGTEGSGNGQFKKPEGVAVAANGTVYVTDAGNERVEEFSSSGAYLAKFGSEGAGGGQFGKPGEHPADGIAVAPNGTVLVADTTNNRVQELTSSGTFIQAMGFGVSDGKGEYEICTSSCRAGVSGTGNGQFAEPYAVAVAPNGNMYVGDRKNERVQEFSVYEEYVTKFNTNGNPQGVAVAPNGNVYVATRKFLLGFFVQEFSPAGTSLAKFGSLGAGNGQFGELGAEGIAVAANGRVYVADPSNDRVQELSILLAASPAPFGSEGAGNGQFKKPDAVAAAPNGNVYVADTQNSRIEEFSPSGEYLAKFGSYGSRRGQLTHPDGIAVASNGNVYVADTGNNRVEEFSPSGEYIAAIALFYQPEGVAIAPNGSIYVADTLNGRVVELSKSGEYIMAWKVEHMGVVLPPTGIAVAPNGNVYVVAPLQGKVMGYTASGGLTTEFGSSGRAEGGQFYEPRGVAIAANGDVYITDAGNNRVQEFSLSGSFIQAMGFGVGKNNKEEYEICTTAGSLPRRQKRHRERSVHGALGCGGCLDGERICRGHRKQPDTGALVIRRLRHEVRIGKHDDDSAS